MIYFKLFICENTMKCYKDVTKTVIGNLIIQDYLYVVEQLHYIILN